MKANEQNHNYIRNQKNKLRIRLEEIEISLKKKGESREKREETYGKYPELIKLGESDRISGYTPKSIDESDKKISYEYGYYIKASRTLAGKFENGIYSEIEQREFGIRDYNNGIKDDYLFKLKDFSHYMNGRIYQMGRNIYDYLEENNLEIDEYINLISLIYPNIASPEFKMGYNEEKESKANKKRR